MPIETYIKEICNNSYAEFAQRLGEGVLVLREALMTPYEDVKVYFDNEYDLEVITRFYIGE